MPILQSLADAERLGVADALEQQQYKDGDIIIKEGDAGIPSTSLKEAPSSVCSSLALALSLLSYVY